ncbi:erythronate-4-phosphate dehydrogenase [Rheinheimera sp. SA_1]|uniref:4-phosphoerythronate dehydrogenase n=1 Tax=Rheinheimera sp. SA_1 TaxID=1827365 RepID=UPI0007FC403A|nr:4-phosphoerythronate dehydrogenase [Rheinheimera sp. SA_1]OBP15597.1 erythronate-4-phosphate dehydrogenase [Rheinheimera sp. SA_1]
MKIYADENMPYVQQFFAELGTVQLVDGRQLTPAQVADADVLLVRSVTQVNAQLLLQNNQLNFVGTATIGVDHIDQAYLKSREISFSSAPGCNAQSVVEYVLSSLFLLAEQQQKPLQQWTVGVVGVGQIGSRLVKALQALQVKVLQSDPLRAANEPDFPHLDFTELCHKVDALSFHVPLVKGGAHPTLKLLNQHNLPQLPPAVTIINASRGEVTCNQALLTEAKSGVHRPLVLDVWDNEPNVLQELVPFTTIATAHIAGHSIEGKARGTEMLYQALCKTLKIQPKHQLHDFCPVPVMEKLQISANFRLSDVQNICRMLYDVRRDDALFRFHLQGHGFDWLRKHYPPRREFSSLQVQLDNPALAIPEFLRNLGFSSRF